MAGLIKCVQRKGTYEEVKFLVESGLSVNHKDIYGMNVLHWCAMYNVPECEEPAIKVVKFVIDCGVDINARGRRETTPLMCFIIRQCPAALISVLLDRGADASCINGQGFAALHFYSFVKNKSLDVCRRLIEGLPNINIPNGEGVTPLSLFLMNGSKKEYIELLLEAGSDPTLRAITDHSVLKHYASWSYQVLIEDNDLEILTRLTQDRSLLNAGLRCYSSALMWFVHHQLPIKPVEFLLLRGADVMHIDDRDGNSVLHMIFSHLKQDNTDVVLLLLEYGASLDAVNRKGETPLSRAIHYKAADFIHLFYNYGLNRILHRQCVRTYIEQERTLTRIHRILFQYMLLDNEISLDSLLTQSGDEYENHVRSYTDILIKELGKMKTHILANELSLFEFLVEPDHRKYVLLWSDNNISSADFFSVEFPEYLEVIKSKIQIVKRLSSRLKRIQRVFITSRSESGLKNDGVRLNLYCFRHVLKFINDIDIKNLVLASLRR